ncbi:SsrA-binding protein SmpB [Lacticaseibacillus camelliae]|uniref:SsrA-binding protein SmpB n=1 Tax=Lacticaseibacillus camelliae TaxID=381742 RepID=UPI000AF9F56F|nr:SsrA-binding protein SmpB [Lacticaseibacillus camelliae]
MAKKMKPKPDNLLAQNKKAWHDYNILETYEAGIALTGTEIKSVRAGKTNLRDGSFALRIMRPGWSMCTSVLTKRAISSMLTRCVLASSCCIKKEIAKLLAALTQQGKTAVPLRMYLKHGYAKVLIGVAEGKKLYDKREALKKKDQKREMARALKERY